MSKRNKTTAVGAAILALCMALSLASCASSGQSSAASASASSSASSASASADASASSSAASTSASASSASSQSDSAAYSDASDGGHAILADGESASYSNISVTKTGEASGDNADFYGENAAIFATNGATLDLTNATIDTDGTHANGVFSYGTGTTVNISDSVINTHGNCSGALMTTGDGTMNATNITAHTTGRSSATIRSDRGGGTVTVNGGTFTTDGSGSPTIYSTADITVSDATLTSTTSQGVVIEGKNSVTLNDVTLTADNNKKNSNKSPYYQAVMIYQSMSGDAKVGEAYFTMNDGTLTNKNGDIFFVNNTSTTIALNGATIVNEDADGVFLRAAAAGWGKEGKNGGKVVLNATNQVIDGDMVVDDISSLDLHLAGTSTLTGAINADNSAASIAVELTDDATWKLTGDSYITSFPDDASAIDLNGYSLYVNGELFK